MRSLPTLCFALLVFITLPRPARAEELAPEVAEKIKALVEKRLPPGGPGAAITVIKEGQVILEHGYGFADIQAKTPPAATTLFDLASVSKQFTATAILLLAERGQLSLEDDVRKYLPELPVYDAKHPVLVKDMLHMASGIPEYDTSGSDLKNPAKATNLEVLHNLAKTKQADFEPNTKYAYTNTNYVLLAAIVERLSKKSMHEFLEAEIFKPLGMSHTTVQDAEHLVKDFATGYRKAKNGAFKTDHDLVTITGDGNVFSCVEDLAKWDQALREGKLLKPESWTLAHTSNKLKSGKDTEYGFGCEVSGTKYGRCIYHTGSWNGTSTCYAWYVDAKVSVIVLCNLSDFDAEELGDTIAHQFMKPAK